MKIFDNRIIIGVIAIFIAVFGYFVLFPQYEKLKEVELINIEKEKKLSYSEEYFSKIKELAIELENYEEEMSKIDIILSDTVSLPNIYKYFQDTSSRAGVILTDLIPTGDLSGNAGTSGTIKEFKINVSVVGSQSAFRNFLSIVEQSSLIIDIENIAFSSADIVENPNDIAFTVTFKMFIL